MIDYVEENRHFSLFGTVLRRRADYGKALDQGLGVAEYDKKSKAAKEFKAFSKEVKEMMEEIMS